jgi:tRNA A37 methylthiotransferase MiaB
MKRRVFLATINSIPHRFSLSIELLAAKIYGDVGLCQKISLIKKTYLAKTPTKKILQQILKSSPHLVAFSCYVWNIKEILELASAIKNDLTQTLIVLGGPETAGIEGKILEKYPFIDCVVMGEGEGTLAHMLESWLQDDSLHLVPGTMIREKDRIITGPYRPPIRDLSKIPSPFNNLIPSPKNKDIMFPLQTLRGCTRSCFYCYYGKGFSTIRYFPVERGGEDLERIKKAGGEFIGIIDPNFFCHIDHAEKVLRILSKKQLRFHVEMNADDLDDKAIDLLAASKCRQINFGLQSANPRTLKLCGRRCNLQRFESNLRRLAKKAPKISKKLDLIYGLPGDTLPDFLNSLDFAFSLPVDEIHFFPLVVIPGTFFYEQPEKWGILFDPNPPHLVYKTCSFFHEDENYIPIANCLLYWFSSYILRAILQYILEKITDPPSQFITRLIAWDGKRKKRITSPHMRNQLKGTRLSDLRYILSGVGCLYPNTFLAQELEFFEEWFNFKRCLERLEKRPRPRKIDSKISGKEKTLWKCSAQNIIGRFRFKPRPDLKNLIPEPLKEKPQQFLIQENTEGEDLCYEIPEGMENLLKFFRKPKTIESYLAAPGDGSKIERYIWIQHAQKEGLILPVS